MSDKGLTGAKLCAQCGHNWRAHDAENVWCVECGVTEKIVTQRDRTIAELEAANRALQAEVDRLARAVNARQAVLNRIHDFMLHGYLKLKTELCDAMVYDGHEPQGEQT